MRTTGSVNLKAKYRCEIILMGNVVLDESYTSLRNLAKGADLPYHMITDVFEGRRNSFMKYQNKKYFPTIKITKLTEEKNDELKSPENEEKDKNLISAPKNFEEDKK